MPAKAQDTIYWLYGWGNKTCADFVAASQDIPIGKCSMLKRTHDLYSENCVFKQFAFGYISEQNFSNKTSGTGVAIENLSENTLDLWLRNYCSQHPLEKFVGAVDALIVDNFKKAQKN